MAYEGIDDSVFRGKNFTLVATREVEPMYRKLVGRQFGSQDELCDAVNREKVDLAVVGPVGGYRLAKPRGDYNYRPIGIDIVFEEK